MNWGWLFVASVLVVAAIVAALAVRRPILFQMALRNALRRPKQTATVIAGLMIGTAIISAALVAGHSATSAIRGAVYDALGPVDESVRMEGFYFFPEAIAQELIDDPDAQAFFDGASPNIFWDAAGDNPRTDLFEPGTTLVGYAAQQEIPFGDFLLQGGGRHDGTGLGPRETIVNAELADELHLRVGDTLRVAYTLPVDPLFPTYEIFGGLLGAGLDPGQALPIPVPANLLGPPTDTHTLDVPDGATRLTVVLVCGQDEGCPAGTTLQVHAIAPDGTVHSASHDAAPDRCTLPEGTIVCPPTPDPLWLNVTDALPGGTWTLEVRGQISTQTPYGLAAVALEPIYNLTLLQERARDLEELPEEVQEFVDTDRFGRREQTDLEVVAISDDGRGLQFDLGPAAFLPLDSLQTMLDRDGQVNYVKFSNPGGIEAGREGTDEALRILGDKLAALRQASPQQAALHELQVEPLKRDFLQVADDTGELMTSLMIFAGSLSILTGLLLIINIFTMLAEERRSELGMARAVGLGRRDLVRLFLFEGSLYAVAAAFIGALLGLALAFGMIAGLNSILASQQSAFPPVPFAPGPSAVPVAFASGALLTFATIFVASRRQSRLNIVRAIRQIDEPPKTGSIWLVIAGLPLAAAGLAIGTFGWLIAQFSMQVFGPLLLAAGLMMALRRYLPRRIVDVTLAASLAAYYAATIFLISDFEDIQEANIVGPIRGVVMTLCLVVLASYWTTGPRLLGRLLAKFRRLRAVATPAVAYPQHKRFRTGMTLAMFAIVILSIGFFSIFGALFEVDPARHTGGYEVEARTTLQVEDLAAYDSGLLDERVILSVDQLADFQSLLPDFITVEGERTGQFGPPQHHVYGIDEAFLDHHEFRLLWTLDDLSQEATYERLLQEPDTVIVGYTYSTNEQGQDLSHEVGETLTIHAGDCRDPVRPAAPGDGRAACPSFTIIGIQEQYHFPGIFLPKQRVADMFPQHRDLFLYNLAPGADAEAVAKDLERNYREIGMDAKASIQEVQEEQEAFNQIFSAMKVFLGLGLIVGVLSLGIITSRSVLERRQEIGMMRAIGYTGHMIRRIFLIETTLIILMGAVIGLLSSIIVTFGLWFAIIRELQYPYVIPWGEVGLLLGISYIVALLATLAPILRASRIAPAEALRYIE